MLQGIPLLAAAAFVDVFAFGVGISLWGTAATTNASGAIVSWIPYVGQAITTAMAGAGIAVSVSITACIGLNAAAFLNMLFVNTYGMRREFLPTFIRRIVIKVCVAVIPVLNCLLPVNFILMFLSVRDEHRHRQARAIGGSAEGEADIAGETQGEEETENADEGRRAPRRPAPVAAYETPAEEEPEQETPARAPLLNTDIRPRAAASQRPYAQAA